MNGDTPKGWPAPPDGLALSPAYVDVWRVATEIEPESVSRLAALLSDEERRKAERLKDAEKRAESIVARWSLRRILSALLRIEPGRLEFATGPHGKPALSETSGGRDIDFNVSHTSGVVLIAVTMGHAVGVDIERVRSDFDWRGVARQFFSAEESAALLGLADHEGRRAFYRQWVRKEAVLKAAGEGMARGTAAVDADRWAVVELEVGPAWAAAVALGGGRAAIRQWTAGLP